MLYFIDLPYACFGLVTENNLIVRAAPIAKWAKGKNINEVLNFYKKKGAKINVLTCE